MPRPRVNGSCAFWKKLILVWNTFPSVPHPLNQKLLPRAAGAGMVEFGAAVKKQGWGCLFFSGVNRGDVLKPLSILYN